MINEHQEELAALEALHLLEGEEKARFDQEAARNPELLRRVDELRAAAAALAHVAPTIEPPSSLKERILTSAESRRQAGEPSNVPKRLLSFPVLIGWSVAACLALTTAWAAQLYFTAFDRNARLVAQQKLADDELQAARSQIESERQANSRELELAKQSEEEARREVAALTQRMKDRDDLAQMKIAALVSLAGDSAQALAVAVWDPENQRGVLSVEKLPAALADKDYQLWVIPTGAGSAPVSAGIFSVDPATGAVRTAFTARKPIQAVAKFAISLEPKGGSIAPVGKIVLVSQ
jgi:anti-sigma-K factor RskA